MDFKVIHHITFVNDWLPSLFIRLKTNKNYFIWGPIGSHSRVPKKFLYTQYDRILEPLRIMLQWIFRNVDPYFKKCKKESDVIIGINPDVKDKLKLNSQKYYSIPAIAINPKSFSEINTNQAKEEFNVLSVGRFIHIKNLTATLRSFAIFFHGLVDKGPKPARLTIIGSGKQKKRLVSLSEELKISEYVDFIDYLPQEQLMNLYENSSLFIFPTLESAGFVILEAMSRCLPIVALDYGGPKQFVLKNRNIQLINPNSNTGLIFEDLALSLHKFYNDRELAASIGAENMESVLSNFTWAHKTKSILKIYDDLLN